MLRIKLIWTTQTIFKHTSLLLLDVRHSTLRHSCPHKKHANLRTIFQTCNYHSHTHIVSTPRTLLSHLSPMPHFNPHACTPTRHGIRHKHLLTNPLTRHTNQVTITHLDTLLYSTLISHTPPPHIHPHTLNPRAPHAIRKTKKVFSSPHTKEKDPPHTGEKNQAARIRRSHRSHREITR